jgi:AAA domain (dynein-related subfamily)
MNINQVKKAVPYLMRAKLPAMLVGIHGVGKTQGIKQYAKENDYILKIVNLGCEDVGDLKGLPNFKKNADKVLSATEFLKPDWAEDMLTFLKENPDKKAILFLDEFNRAKRDLIQACFPLLTENRLGQVQFPENLYVMAAINPGTEDYTTLDLSDKALMDRFCHIKITSSYQDFIEYGKVAGINPSALNFINAHPAMLRANTKEFNLNYVEPSDRSWEKAGVLVDMYDKKEMDETMLNELLVGLVGLEASTAYMSWKKTAEKPIEGALILSDYKKVRKEILAQTDEKNYRSDLINETRRQVVEVIKEKGEKTLTDKEYKNLVAFMLDVPNDMFIDFSRELFKIPHVFELLCDETALHDKIEKCEAEKKKEEDKAEKKA